MAELTPDELALYQHLKAVAAELPPVTVKTRPLRRHEAGFPHGELVIIGGGTREGKSTLTLLKARTPS